MSTFSSAFTRRGRASEGSFTREADKIKLRKLRDELAKEGKLPPKSMSWGRLPTVDQLAEISAHSVPYSVSAHNAEPTKYEIRVPPPDSTKPIPELPTTSQVAGDIYREYTGKKVWLQNLNMALESGTARDASRICRQTRRQAVRSPE